MKEQLRTLLAAFGLLKPIQKFRNNRQLQRRFVNDFNRFSENAQRSESRFEFSWKNRNPYLHDRTSKTGFDRHYVYHPAWAARILAKTTPEYHVDISSTLYFCALVSAFMPVRFYDYRPAILVLEGLTSGSKDLTALDFADNSVKSLSCMHTVEHIGLGRYGDPVDYEGDLKAMRELTRVLAPGGDLLFVVPVGHKAQIQFNGHRIYTRELVLQCFKGLHLQEFTLIPECEVDGGLVVNPSADLLAKQVYGCGCFWFKKGN
jgi:SAM-dependent methyltransferase